MHHVSSSWRRPAEALAREGVAAAAPSPLRLPALLRRADWAALALLVAWLAGGALPPLWASWRADAALSHGPLVPLIALGLLLSRRSRLTPWAADDPAGLALLCLSALVHVVSVWADVVSVAAISLVGVLAGIIWFLAGRRAIAASAGALGFLLFMVPWPTTLVERLAFPMQLLSSSYAALLSGLVGVHVQRSGVELSAVPTAGAAPAYSLLVAQKCSGLTSLTVLLALGYLVSYFTPVLWGWRVLLVAAVVPMALLANAVRLTAVLAAGVHHGPALAAFVHDNEGPFLIVLCSAGLLGLRRALMGWTPPCPAAHEEQSALPIPHDRR